jgi:GTP cyclohydrolase I
MQNTNGNHQHILIRERNSQQFHPELVTVEQEELIEDAVRQILVAVGENPERDGLLKTPNRVARMYDELLEGYTQDLETVVNEAMFEVENLDAEMVVVADIEYNSLCEHHMLPFVGKAHIAYIPGEKVIGLSKIPRIVDMFAHRLQIQERMTNEIADAIEEAIDAVGVMVLIEGHHMCGSLRGLIGQVGRHPVYRSVYYTCDRGIDG